MNLVFLDFAVSQLLLEYAVVLLLVKQLWYYQPTELDSVTYRINLTIGTHACDVLENKAVIKETPMW
jgi:hypothetical protein